jgi:hypothetical protein
MGNKIKSFLGKYLERKVYPKDGDEDFDVYGAQKPKTIHLEQCEKILGDGSRNHHLGSSRWAMQLCFGKTCGINMNLL